MRPLFFLLVAIFVGVFYFFAPIPPLWQWFHDDISEEEKLILENESLKAQLLEYKLQAEKRKTDDNQYIKAKIFSTYPFNDRHIFTINAGNKDGVKESNPVLAEKNILLGKVIKVFENYSEVESVFSPEWRLSVKIGQGGTDGLLIGGPDPKVEMIVSDKTISAGEEIYSASKEFPYGFKIAAIKSLSEGETNLFQKASLEFPYNFNNLLEVLIYVQRIQ